MENSRKLTFKGMLTLSLKKSSEVHEASIKEYNQSNDKTNQGVVNKQQVY